jgi:DNA-binding response OmpR family regulator
MRARILIVDDEPEQVRKFALILEQEGCDVVIAQDDREALYLLEQLQPDLMILDIRFGYHERMGLDILKEIRELRNDKTTPIIVLTGLGDEELEWLSLKYGAIDFARKTIPTKALLERIKARLPSALRRPVLINDRIKLDLDNYAVEVKLDGHWQEVHLQPRQLELLRKLVSNPGQVITREALYDLFPQAEDPSNTLNHHISILREKLEPDPANPQYILTKRGIGYWFQRYE